MIQYVTCKINKNMYNIKKHINMTIVHYKIYHCMVFCGFISAACVIVV